VCRPLLTNRGGVKPWLILPLTQAQRGGLLWQDCFQ
jgi:hypothetical protein